MTREEAIQVLQTALTAPFIYGKYAEALNIAIEALQAVDNCDQCEWCCPSDGTPTIHVVRCKDCRHADECHKSVQYTRNEPNTVTIGYAPIEWCSHGERREP